MKDSSMLTTMPSATAFALKILFLFLVILSVLMDVGVGDFVPSQNLSTYEARSTMKPFVKGNSYSKIMTEPYFDPATPQNITALMGKSAYLSCQVHNLSNRTVSWIRHRDVHILTVGSYTYTSDQRFQATHYSDSDDWRLQIKWAQKRDSGIYECQISTQPVRSFFVRLNVVVPTASIHGGPDLHFNKGSTINLTCTVDFSLEPPAYIFWYHHEEVINYDSSRGGVSVITEKSENTVSYLLIQNADLEDSGKYSCAPSNADVASVRVHVLNGSNAQTVSSGSGQQDLSPVSAIFLVFIKLCLRIKSANVSSILRRLSLYFR